MKYAFVALALAALAQAQTRADIPSCALPCLDDAVKANTKCETTDYACVCKNFDAVQAQATSCVITKCGTDVAINKVLPATQALCAAAGSGSGASSAASSAAQSSPAQSPPAQSSTSAPQSSAAQSSSTPVSSPPASSPPPQTTPAGPVGTGTGVPPPPPGNRTTTGAPTAPTNAGSALLPGLAMLALGALAL
ncbi:hypothetical protein V8C42DRAFT_330406 [Trichoderma barbatum]